MMTGGVDGLGSDSVNSGQSGYGWARMRRSHVRIFRSPAAGLKRNGQCLNRPTVRLQWRNQQSWVCRHDRTLNETGFREHWESQNWALFWGKWSLVSSSGVQLKCAISDLTGHKVKNVRPPSIISVHFPGLKPLSHLRTPLAFQEKR